MSRKKWLRSSGRGLVVHLWFKLGLRNEATRFCYPLTTCLQNRDKSISKVVLWMTWTCASVCSTSKQTTASIACRHNREGTGGVRIEDDIRLAAFKFLEEKTNMMRSCLGKSFTTEFELQRTEITLAGLRDLETRKVFKTIPLSITIHRKPRTMTLSLMMVFLLQVPPVLIHITKTMLDLERQCETEYL